MDADYGRWKLWLDVVQLLAISGVWLYTWWMNREAVTAKRFAALEKEVGARATEDAMRIAEENRDDRCALHLARTGSLELAVTRIDTEVHGLPGTAGLNEVHGRVTDVQRQLSEMNGHLDAIGRTVGLIQEHLLRDSKP